MSEVINVEISKLKLDYQNPRLSEFGINEKAKQEEILELLWDEMAVNELMYSIVSNGFWDYEPLTIMKVPNTDSFLVIEGNRRLAAVLLIHNPGLIKKTVPKHITDKISENDELLIETKSLPSIIISKRDEAWRFVGFKHVNGPVKWGSFAKAKYIVEIHNEYGIALNDIAYQIGDTNNTVQKLYQGFMVLEQANRVKVYNYDDIQDNRIYFSHLYTGLQREGIREYLQIKNAEDESPSPVPESRYKELGQLLEWLFGSKKNDTPKIIKSQNPDLKYLDEVLQSKEATMALSSGEALSYSYELSRASDALFEENLLIAKRSLQKTRAYLTTGYKGEENILKVAGSVAELADDLYEEMDKVSKKLKEKTRKSRLTE